MFYRKSRIEGDERDDECVAGVLVPTMKRLLPNTHVSRVLVLHIGRGCSSKIVSRPNTGVSRATDVEMDVLEVAEAK